MPLAPGDRLGPYAIAAQIGIGGMGEVYRATDMNLGRDVAIKVLPDTFAQDPDRLARFEREARTLAALSHPNIAIVHGVEIANGIRGLVMELVEGPTLADRIAQGPLPVETTLAIARQIAEALEAAHERGIVHRDLKPANVKLRDDGIVKVLDFGLAKLIEASGDRARDNQVAVSDSPTLSLMATQAGMILGTAAYMSPEQAEGKPTDHRSDIFSFGSLLYELLTGRPAFRGDSAAAILASVLIREPDLSALPPRLDPRLAELLKRCLDKNPKRRWQAAGDLRAEIEAIAAMPQTDPPPTGAREASLWRRALPSAATAIVVCALTSGAWWLLAPGAPAPRLSRLTVPTPAPADLWPSDITPSLAITPDGTRIVYVGGNNGSQLFVRALDALEAVVIVSGQPRSPFVSPDGQWVGFFEYNEIRKVPITGGPSTRVTVTEIGNRGATWAPDDTIIFATGRPTTGLQRVPAAGGTPETLTTPDRARGEADHLWPEFLPDGRAVLFTIQAQAEGPDASQIAILDLQTNMRSVLVQGGTHPKYMSSGHLVYTAGGTLRAVSFNPAQRAIRGTSVPFVSRVATTQSGAAEYATATNGTLIYVDRGQLTGRTLTWVDRVGKEDPITSAPARLYVQPRISPDGTRIAFYVGDQERDIWIWDLKRENLARLTSGAANDLYPLWTPDGQRIIFASSRNNINMWSQAADGTGQAQQLTSADAGSARVPYALARDGSLVFGESKMAVGTADIKRDTLEGKRIVTPVVATEFDERNAVLAPNSRWLAYDSDSSGRREVYVRPYPMGEGQSTISTAGGQKPLWSRNGTELFYLGVDGAMMRVSVDGDGTTFKADEAVRRLEAIFRSR